MQLSSQGLALIQHYEGLALVPYYCPAGYLTVGYGHVLGPDEPVQRIDAQQALAYLRRDVQRSERSVNGLISTPLTQGQFDALVSFTFNLGSAALQRSRLRARLNRGEVMQAADEFDRWVFARGRKLPGLIRRRAAEKRLFQGVDWAG